MVGRAFYGLRKVFWELGCLAFLAFYVRMGRQRIVGFTANCQYEIGLLGWTDGIFFFVCFSQVLIVVGGPSLEAVGVTHWDGKMNRATGLILLFSGRLKIFFRLDLEREEEDIPLVRLMMMYMTFLLAIAYPLIYSISHTCGFFEPFPSRDINTQMVEQST